MLNAHAFLDQAKSGKYTDFVRAQAPQTFFEKLQAELLEHGWTQRELDLCLFIRVGMICVVLYVDDAIFASANVKDLDTVITSFLGIVNSADQRHAFAIRDEGKASTLPGIQIMKTGENAFFLTQTRLLIDKVFLSAGHQDEQHDRL